MRHLQRFSSFDQDAVLSPHPRAHHHRRRGGQPQGAGAGDGQNGDGGLEGDADDDLGSGDLLGGTLRSGKGLNISELLAGLLMVPEIYREVLLHQVEVAEAHEQPGGEREQSQQQDERNKEPAQPVGQLLDGRLADSSPQVRGRLARLT